MYKRKISQNHFFLVDPVLTPSSVNVTAITGDGPISLSCTVTGTDPALSAVRWRVNGTVLTVEEEGRVTITSSELVSTLTISLVEPGSSGLYTCELVEYPSASANISVAVKPGQCSSAYAMPTVVMWLKDLHLRDLSELFNPSPLFYRLQPRYFPPQCCCWRDG